MSKERGVIRHKGRAKQLNNFKGLLRPRNITPTDIDGVIDYGGKFFVYIEGKLKGKLLSDESGQKQALEAIIKSHWKAGHPSILILFEHNTPIDEEVDVASQVVRTVFGMQQIPTICLKQYSGTFWWMPHPEMSVIKAVEFFEAYNQIFPATTTKVPISADYFEACISASPKATFERFNLLEQAEAKYQEYIATCKADKISCIICLRSYRGQDGTMIKNERL